MMRSMPTRCQGPFGAFFLLQRHLPVRLVRETDTQMETDPAGLYKILHVSVNCRSPDSSSCFSKAHVDEEKAFVESWRVEV